MATLPSENIDQVWAQVMREFSAVHEVVPINKHQFRALLVLIDGELEGAEVSIVQALPPGEGKDWLVGNQPIGRELIIRVEEKRKEVL